VETLESDTPFTQRSAILRVTLVTLILFLCKRGGETRTQLYCVIRLCKDQINTRNVSKGNTWIIVKHTKGRVFLFVNISGSQCTEENRQVL